MYEEVSHDIYIHVTPTYDEVRSQPAKSFYYYFYTITITNKSSNTVRLVDRHWIITDGLGHVEEVKGEGVVGETPILEPGASYTYTSACPLTTKTGNMRGTYGITKGDERLRVKIPLFFLRTPDTFH
jgi:ApaG protein